MPHQIFRTARRRFQHSLSTRPKCSLLLRRTLLHLHRKISNFHLSIKLTARFSPPTWLHSTPWILFSPSLIQMEPPLHNYHREIGRPTSSTRPICRRVHMIGVL